MGSGSVTGTTNHTWIVSRITWTSSIVPGENASNVTVNFQLKGHSSSGLSPIYGTGYWVMRVAGTDYNVSLSIADGSVVTFDDKWRTYGTVTKKITHNADGTRSVPFRVTGGMSASAYTDTYLSGNFVLDTISQACTITAVSSVVTVNGSSGLSITIGKPTASYYAVAKITLGSRSQSIGISGTTAYYTIPAAWADQITGSSRTGTVTLTTYTDSTMATQVGSPASATWTAVLPSASAPTLASGWATVAAYNDSASGIPSDWNVALAGRSRAKVTFDSSKISLSSGASISSYSISYAGTTYGSPYTTNVIAAAGTATIIATVTDSRGYSASEALTLTVEPYAAPTLSQVSLYRSNSGGVASQAGGYIYASANVDYSSVGGRNSVSLRCRYKSSASSSWGGWQTLTSGAGLLMGGGDLDPKQSYDAQIQAVDALGSATTYSETTSTEGVTFNLLDGGMGAAFGKYASRSMWLESAWGIHTDKDAEINGSLTVGGNINGAAYPPTNVASADKLTTPRKITLSGGATGSATFDGSGDVTINTIVSLPSITPSNISGTIPLNKGGTGKSVTSALALFQALGLDIVMGTVTGVTTTAKTVSFGRTMSGVPKVFVCQNSGTNSPEKVTSITTTGFNIACSQSSACGYNYIAVYWGL